LDIGDQLGILVHGDILVQLVILDQQVLDMLVHQALGTLVAKDPPA
jgi:hypothetical protein